MYIVYKGNEIVYKEKRNMKKIAVSLFLAVSFILSAFVGVACGENTPSSSESNPENSVVQSESVTDSTKNSIDNMEESTTSSVESSVESADSSVVTGTPIEYELLHLNRWAKWEGSPEPQIATSMEELVALFDMYKVTWYGELFVEGLPEDYFEEKAIVFYFYLTSGDNVQREIQGVFLEGNILRLDMLATSKDNWITNVIVYYLFSVGIDKAYVEKIEKINLNRTFSTIE